jgi:ubiquinone/menaquinone biosynthesis C-methylase UbiE
MEARLQRRIQRYGWDLAAPAYQRGWQAQLAPAHTHLLAHAALEPGAAVLDVACGTGLVTFAAAWAVGSHGRVLGTDLSERMIEHAHGLARERRFTNVDFARMDAEQLALPDASFDVVLCALGLMFVPDPLRAIDEMRRVVRPGGRVAIAVWGERARCSWSSVFPILEAEVASEVCPHFFRMGQGNTLARTCSEAGLADIHAERLAASLHYASGDDACEAALIGGPGALAWSRFDAAVRARVRARYLESLAPWRDGAGYRLPAEFVIVAARVSGPTHPFR